MEHTITEATTGVDIVEAQILVAGGRTLKDLNLLQHQIQRTFVSFDCFCNYFCSNLTSNLVIFILFSVDMPSNVVSPLRIPHKVSGLIVAVFLFIGLSSSIFPFFPLPLFSVVFFFFLFKICWWSRNSFGR